MSRDRVPWWGLLSAAAAPVLLVGGWTVAAARQPDGYDPVTDTISSLAARGATDRWLMTTALLGLGVCHLVTAAALRPARPRGRAVLALGGVTTVLVAAFPLPADESGSTAHGAAAGAAFVALAVWPVLAARTGGPPVLRVSIAGTATAVLLGLVGWFVAELATDGSTLGVAERAAAGAQSLWPLVTVVAAFWWARAGRT